jgi:hypothetical protein
MRFLLAFIWAMLLLPLLALAQVQDITPGTWTPGFYSQKNYVKNSSCWANTKDISTSGGGAIARTTSSPLDGVASCSVSSTTAAGKVTWALKAFDNSLKYRTCQAVFTYDGNGTNWKAYLVRSGSAISDYITLEEATGLPKPGIINYDCGDLSVATTLVLEALTTPSPAIKVSKVYTGLYVQSRGPIVTDSQAFTPTGSMTTNTTYTGTFARTGEKASIRYKLAFAGAPNSVSLTVNMPAGLSIDTNSSRLPNGTLSQLCRGHFRDATDGLLYDLIARYTSSTALEVYVLGTASTYGGFANNLTQAIPVTIASGDLLDLECPEVPIVGWSSNMALSDNNGTRNIAMSATGNAGTAVTSSVTDIPFTTTSYDTTSSWSGTTFTAPEAGIYDIIGSVRFTAAISASIDLYVGGVQTRRIGTGSSNASTPFSGSVQLSAGQAVTLRSDTSGTLSNSSGTLLHTISISKRQTPQTLAGGETVAASATQSAGTSLPNTGSTDISWDSTKAYDTHGALSGTTFTAPSNGKYRSCARLKFTSGAWASSNSYAMNLKKNGSIYKYYVDTQLPSGATFELNLSGPCVDVPLLRGDTLVINVSHNRTAGAITLAASTTQNYWDIIKVGN